VVLTGSYWGIEREMRNCCVRRIGKLLTEGMCVVLSCMVSCDDWRLLGDRMGMKILVGEKNWERADCRRVHNGELHGE